MLAILFTAALAAASALAPRPKTPLDYPPRVSGAAFTLIANVTSSPPNRLFNPNNWALTAERVGAGQYAIVLSPTVPGTRVGNRLAELRIGYGTGEIGMGIGIGLRDPYAKLFPPVGMQSGTFIVCHVENPTYGRPEYPVYWAIEGVSIVEENCEGITLLAQCAPLPEIVGEQELGIVKAPVACYEDVKGIDWSKW
ncbi:hypothetical protein B0T14DRAFT_561383 [Immersiella caudata]|uniref:Uncharacterized protein n=1 Tax=Immersiella caudata TaxID=314043 RepID=A0AA39XH03_9PEZI|nr:hypothetical protein B0T14DRAFT_561383 [Immersiella caudata]